MTNKLLQNVRKLSGKGFTLVELLIVIALISILSVAVLATINPIEQSNKARDARVQNDAAEVLNAYERYYTNSATYPWMDVTGSTIASVDEAYSGRSSMVGFGLCGTASVTGVSQTTGCDTQTTQGKLIETQELKESFLSKSYTRVQTDPAWTFQDELYAVKTDNTSGNSIFVCYVPKAKANRNPPAAATWKLKSLAVTGTDNVGVATQVLDASVAQMAAATYVALAGDDTLFRCVPE